MNPSRRYNSAFDDLDLLRKRPLSDYWRADFRPGQLETPHARTKLRKVCRGKFTQGPQKGMKCAIKFFHRGGEGTTESVYSDLYHYNNDVANYVVANWNAERNMAVRVGVSYVWEFLSNSSKYRRRKPCVVEPYIPRYHRWNSNSGWCATATPVARMMQAISHYSYALSRGNLVLCELQGGLSPRSKTPILVSPAVASMDAVGGSTDLGQQGIYLFFQNHTCNEYCDPRWKKPTFKTPPEDIDPTVRRKRGTTYWHYGKEKYI